MKILIVDDNAAVRRLIRQAIREITEEVQECSDGNQVLTAYASFMPDMVLMDIRMPGMDGLVATRCLKQAYPAANVVIVTDYDDNEVREAAHEAGASDYALKQDLTNLEEVILRNKPISEANGAS